MRKSMTTVIVLWASMSQAPAAGAQPTRPAPSTLAAAPACGSVDGPSNSGLFWVREDGRFGYIDARGELVIPARFTTTYGFSEGLAATKLDGKVGFIDTTGEWAIPPQYAFSYGFSEGVAWTQRDAGGKYGAIDCIGRWVIDPTFDEMPQFFSEGRAIVKIDGRYGYVDRTGQLVIPAKYDKPHKFVGGAAQVHLDGKHLWIDRDGHVLWTER
jgi:hypothetical protein